MYRWWSRLEIWLPRSAKSSLWTEITYSDDNKYTSQVLLDAITNALSKAEKNPGSTKEKSTKPKPLWNP